MANTEFFAYTQLTPIEYGGLILSTNENRREELKVIFADFPLHSQACLVLTGSDGKQERQTRSKTEISLWQYPNATHTDHDLIDWYNDYFGLAYPDAFDSQRGEKIDLKTIGGNQVLSFAFQDSSLVYPDRMLNASYLTGNEDVYVSGRKAILEELGKNDEVSKRIRRKMVEQLKNYNRAGDKGYNGSPTFTLDPPIQFYDWENRITGFKMPVLRLVQRFLDLKTLDAVKSGRLDPNVAAGEIPTFTIKRMGYLGCRGLAPLHSEAKASYLWFLQQYNFAQEKHCIDGNLVRLPFNIEEYRKHISILSKYVKRD